MSRPVSAAGVLVLSVLMQLLLLLPGLCSASPSSSSSSYYSSSSSSSPAVMVAPESSSSSSSACLLDCGDFGSCGSDGQCHCFAGYAGPLCQLPPASATSSSSSSSSSSTALSLGESSSTGSSSSPSVDCSFTYSSNAFRLSSNDSSSVYSLLHFGHLSYDSSTAKHHSSLSSTTYRLTALQGQRLLVDQSTGSIVTASTSLLHVGFFDKNDNLIAPLSPPFFHVAGLAFSCDDTDEAAAVGCGSADQPMVNLYYQHGRLLEVDTQQLTNRISFFALQCEAAPRQTYTRH